MFDALGGISNLQYYPFLNSQQDMNAMAQQQNIYQSYGALASLQAQAPTKNVIKTYIGKSDKKEVKNGIFKKIYRGTQRHIVHAFVYLCR